MSLRLWSDAHDLSEVVQELGLTPKHILRKGELVHPGRRNRPYLPNRNYVSLPEVEIRELGQVEPWLVTVFDRLEASRLTANLIKNGTVEAVPWIAVFAKKRVELPAVSSEIVQRARSLGIKIFIENYSFDPVAEDQLPGPDENNSHSGPEIPTKTWYPAT